MLLHISQSKSRGISYLNARQHCRSWTITQKSVIPWVSTNQHITTNDFVNALSVSSEEPNGWKLTGYMVLLPYITLQHGFTKVSNLINSCLLLTGYAKEFALKVLYSPRNDPQIDPEMIPINCWKGMVFRHGIITNLLQHLRS